MASPPHESSHRISAAGCGLAGLYLLLVLLSLGLAFLGGCTLIDARQFGRRADFVWGIAALACAPVLFAGSVAALVHLKSRGPRAWRTGFVLLAAATATNLVLAGIGSIMVAQARARGGDWGALHVGMTSLLCVDAPILVAILTGVACACHRQRRKLGPPNNTVPHNLNPE
jgi:hypothetical protein